MSSEAKAELAHVAPCPFRAPPNADVDSALASTTGVAYPKLYANKNIAPREIEK
jgi:hypothetical protein